MELLLSSPLPIAGIFLALVILGVFVFELKSRKSHDAKAPPLPPTSIPMPKPVSTGPDKKMLLAGGGVLVLLAFVIPVTVVLVSQKQTTEKQASESTVPPVTPVTSQTPSKLSASPTGEQSTSASTSSPVSCLAFTADPSSGRVPLTVSFEAKAQDDADAIAAFEFDFGDGSKQPIEKSFAKGTVAAQSVDHVYTQEGNYTATVRARNDKNTWSEITDTCSITILTSTGSDASISSDGAGGSAPTRTPTPNPGTGGSTKTATPSATAKPTVTPSRTPTPKTASGSAVTKPSVPEAGTSLPTFAILVGSMLLMITALALAL